MKATPEELSKLAERLKEFLIEKEWTANRSSNGLIFYYAPQSLGIEGKYSIGLPENINSKKDTASLLYSASQALVDLYGFGNIGDLLSKAASFKDSSLPTRFATRFIDATTQKGSIPLTSIASYATNFEAGLYRSAKFQLGAETKETKLIAQRFVKDCFFLQTQEGSFIAKVEIPHSVLKQGDLFGSEPIVSTEICSSLFSAFHFLNEKILGDDEPFESPQILSNAIALFDVEMLESLTKVVVGSEIENIEFTIEIGNQIRTSSTGWMTSEKKDRLKDFLDFIREQLRGEDDLDISGSIVELRSRDPEGNKNYIRVASVFHGDKTFISAALTNEQYQRALDAHRNKRDVRIKGNGTRLKTQIRLTEVTEFIG